MLKPRGIVRGHLLTLYKPYKKATFLRAISPTNKLHWAHVDVNLLFEEGQMKMPP